MPFQKEIDGAQAQVNLARNELSILTEKTESAVARLEAAKKDITELADTIKQKKQQKKQLLQDIEATTSKYKETEKEFVVWKNRPHIGFWLFLEFVRLWHCSHSTNWKSKRKSGWIKKNFEPEPVPKQSPSEANGPQEEGTIFPESLITEFTELYLHSVFWLILVLVAWHLWSFRKLGNNWRSKEVWRRYYHSLPSSG